MLVFMQSSVGRRTMHSETPGPQACMQAGTVTAAIALMRRCRPVNACRCLDSNAVVQGAGRQLAAKLKAYLRPKCHAALLDPAVNTPATVRLNIFQARRPCGIRG